MRLYAGITDGDLRISNMDDTSDRPLVVFDTNADDFEEKVTAWCTERRAFSFTCSSSCDFPEDDGAPKESHLSAAAQYPCAGQEVQHGPNKGLLSD